MHEFVFFIFGLLKLFLKGPSLCEKRWFCLTKNQMKYKVKLVRLGKGYAIEVETISVTNAYIQARQKLCFRKGFANDDNIINHSCVEIHQGQEMDWFFDILNKRK